MDIQEAYKIFGLTENSTDEEIEKQYLKWIRRSKASQLDSTETQSVDIEIINTAYNTIKTYRLYGTENPKEATTTRDKIQHFFHYYKLHTIGVIALILIVIAIVQGVINNYQEKKELASLPDENVSIMFFGSYLNTGLSSTEELDKQLADNVLALFPDWERVTTIINYNPREVRDGSDIGLQQKSALLLATEKPDVYIMDLEIFQLHVKTGMFLPINQSSLTADGESSKDRLHYAKSEEDTEEHLYGVEITDESLFNGVMVDNEVRKIAAIRIDAKNKQNAIDLIEKLASPTEN